MCDWIPSPDGVFLQPGEIFTTSAATRVKTVLGSCVAITMRAPRLGLSSIAHCLLPEAGTPLDRIASNEAPRYVDSAIHHMLQTFARSGADVQELEIKLFGGADAFCTEYSVGKRNVDAARAALASRGLAAAASVVGGAQGRVLRFDTGTGDVLLKTLPSRADGRQAVRG